MFQQSAALAVAREIAARIISLQAALKPIQRLVASQPNPDAIAAAAVAEKVRR
jgi:hypothetical protein